MKVSEDVGYTLSVFLFVAVVGHLSDELLSPSGLDLCYVSEASKLFYDLGYLLSPANNLDSFDFTTDLFA